MKALIVSDIHLEHGAAYSPPNQKFDVVIAAGDIDSKGRSVASLSRLFPEVPVLFVPGNHEYYGSPFPHHLHDLCRSAEGTNVTVMDRDIVKLQDPTCPARIVTFLGSTLWTDLQLDGDDGVEAGRRVSCFHAILGMSRTLWRKEHAHSKQWILDQLSNNPDAVLITHYFPVESSHPRWARSGINSAFASHLPMIFEKEPRIWIHGHTHDPCDYVLNKTRVVCAPRGYPGSSTQVLPPKFIYV